VCWICYSGNVNNNDKFISPCRCRGDLKWCHQSCLLMWVDEKQKGSDFEHVKCPQCQTEYVIIYPKSSVFLASSDLFLEITNIVFPYLGMSGVLYCCYISCVTYGFYAVVQVMGVEEAQQLLWQSAKWTWRYYFGLPLIPISLVFSRLSSSFDVPLLIFPMVVFPLSSLRDNFPNPPLIMTILPWVRLTYNSLFSSFCRFLEKFVTPGITYSASVRKTSRTGEYGNEGSFIKQPAQTIVGALLMPGICSLMGSLFLRNYISSTFNRNILGGCIFIVVKDILTLFYENRKQTRQKSRSIANFDESNK